MRQCAPVELSSIPLRQAALGYFRVHVPKDVREARAFKLAMIRGAVEAIAAAGAPRSDMVWHFAMMVQVGAQPQGSNCCGVRGV